MAKFTNFYKVIQQGNIELDKISDNQELGNPSSFANNNWYHNAIHGPGNRIAKYREYDMMDSDVDISRALDLIAEEITGNTNKLDDPFQINVINQDHISLVELETLKIALNHWVELHNFKNKIFKIARYCIKYGDIVFIKESNISKWKFIHPKNILSAIVNNNDISDIRGWQIKNDTIVSKSGYASSSQLENAEIYDKSEVIRFTLNDDMSESAPFGESVLKPVFKIFKQKELLEDAVIIYRIQRAPERRVFYIDVGKMPPNRVKQYLEQIKNEIRQKKIPTHNGQNSEIESVYNPQNQSEDYFLAQKCISFNTLIPLLNGQVKTLSELIVDYDKGIENWVYSINKETGEYIPGKISWAGPTRKDAELVRVLFDNGEYLDCTPDHKLITDNGKEIEAINIKPYTPMATVYIEKPSIIRTKVISVETLDYKEDTGCLTIEDPRENHNFGISAGVYICNSDGRGSKIETLPGGAGLGEISDVEYFSDKLFRGLRIPLSYMRENDGGNAIFNDGRLGQAYITELRFSLYIERLQKVLEETFDYEFKQYLKFIGLKIDAYKFNIVLPEPSNFGKYREQELYASLLSSYSSADSIEYLSKKFILAKYLQLTNEEILENERMKLIEIGEDPDNPSEKALTKIYAADMPGEDSDGFGDIGSSPFGGDNMIPDSESGMGEPPSELPIE